VTRPPALAMRWLERSLHPDERDELIGDLQEQFERRVALEGQSQARRWYWRQTFGLVWGFTRARRDVISTSHDRRLGRWAVSNVALDWTYAWRSLRASRSFALVAVLTLTLGIGLSTAVFSLVEGVLLAPLPYPDPDRLLRLAEIAPPTNFQSRMAAMGDRADRSSVSDVAIGAWIATTRTLESITPISTNGANVRTPHGVEQVDGAEVGSAFFAMLGVRPVLGRLLVDADGNGNAAPAAVLSERFWRASFDARPDIVGSSVTIEDHAYTIVGIAPEVTFPETGVAVWTAGHWQWPAIGPRRMFSVRLDVIARLRRESTLDQARAEGAGVMKRIALADPAFADGTVPIATARVRTLRDDLTAPVHGALVTLMVGMVLVLAAAGVNLASLLLARSTARRREVAVRLALGAARWRLVRPLLFEQGLLAASGAVAGAVVAWWILRSLPLVAPPDLPRLSEIHFSVVSLVFAAGGSLAIGLIPGLWPTWHFRGVRLRHLVATRVGDDGRVGSGDRTRRTLVVTQVALAATLLVGAALIGRTLVALLEVNPGYDPRGVLTFQVALPDGWGRQAGREGRFFDGLIARLEQNPDVAVAGASATLPLLQVGFAGSFAIVGRPKPQTPDETPVAIRNAITPGYLKAVGTHILRGRDFTSSDSNTAEKVAIVDEALVQAYFPAEDPLGQHIGWSAGRVFTVVGVAESAHQGPVSTPVQPTLYMAAAQLPDILAFNAYTGGVAVRTKSDPINVVPFVRTAARELEPDAPIYNVMRLEDRLNRTFTGPRFYAIALGLFAILALSTAILGVYGVLAYLVERRRVEFGVRRALGAGERQIGWLVLSESLRLSGAGLGVGLAAAASAAGLMRSLLFGVRPVDPLTFAGAAGLILLVAAGAAWYPSRRALRVDPSEALRME
jgi:predicted permease